jgi:hypothetical protein
MRHTAKQKVSIPTLQERVEALMEELEEALDALAAERKALADKNGPEGGAMPCSVFRRMMDARGFGDCLCRSYLNAMKEENKR